MKLVVQQDLKVSSGILGLHVFGASMELDATLHVEGMGWNAGEFHGVQIVNERRQRFCGRAKGFGDGRLEVSEVTSGQIFGVVSSSIVYPLQRPAYPYL